VIAFKAIRTAAMVALAAVCLALGAVTAVPAALGLEHYVIVGGSMDGTIDRGSVVFERSVPTTTLRVGDVITYTPPSGPDSSHLVTHRIVSIGSARNGQRLFRTKGDANAAPDPWRFTLDQPQQPQVVGHVPYLGYALAGLEIRWVRMLAIGLPALAIAISVLTALVREAREERSIEAELDAEALLS
jgi:signal peptidase